MPNDEATPPSPLPRKTVIGPFVRIVEPGRHVYRTWMNPMRWAAVVVTTAGAAVCAWATKTVISDFEDERAFMIVFASLFFLVTAVLVFIAVSGVTSKASVEITRETIRLYNRPFFRPFAGKTFAGRWSLEAFQGFAEQEFPTFHIGGSTPLYCLLLLVGGEELSVGPTFDFISEMRAFIDAVTDSIRRAVEWPDDF